MGAFSGKVYYEVSLSLLLHVKLFSGSSMQCSHRQPAAP